MNLIRIRISNKEGEKDIKFFKVTEKELNQIVSMCIDIDIAIRGYYNIGISDEYRQVLFDRDYNRNNLSDNSDYDEIANDVIPILRENSIDVILK